jgi:mono/diheme cytochrome c family protein
MANKRKRIMKKITVKSAVVVAAVSLLSSCGTRNPQSPGNEFMPDMYRSSSYETYSENPVFSDGMTARKPPEGSIPRGFMPYGYDNNFEGYEAAGRELKNPLSLNDKIREEGKVLYINFCTPCHGETGKGDGTLVQRDKFPPPPSFSNQLKDLNEGKMFHSITHGKGLMGSHAHQLDSDERWKIVHYLQELQKL